MKKLSFVVLGAVALLAACSDSPSTPRLSSTEPARMVVLPSQAGAPIADEYIVVFQDNESDVAATARELAAANGATIRFLYKSALKGFAGHMSSAAATALSHNPHVAYVEQDQSIALNDVETMDSAGDPWGLDRIDAASGLSGTYNYTLSGTGVTAYIIDTGILTTHVEFGGRASSGYTAITDGNGTVDCNGHGTHVSGTVGGATYGVAKNVNLVAVRVLDCSGSGTSSGVAAGIDWVTAHRSGPSVANMSLGGGASTALDQAVTNSIAAGVTYAIAAGNGNMAGIAQDACNYSPARVAAAITVGATTKTDAKTSWSNYGNCVDLFAPGLSIKSSWIGSNTATNTISGTSMATPHTTGVAALYLSANPSATPQQVRDGLVAATTKGIVTSSKTTNNNLLYSPPEGFGGVTPPSNTPPTASFTVSCTDLICSFTDHSTDDGTVTGWSWNFDDGTATNTTKSPSHTFPATGSYNVQLTVTDNLGATGTTSQQVSVTAATPSAGTLTATTTKTKSQWTVALSWSGFASSVSAVNVYKNNALLNAGAPANGTYTDSGKGGGTFTYKVCDAANTTSCSNSVTVTP